MSRDIEKLFDLPSTVSEVERYGFSLRDLPEPHSVDEARDWLNQLEMVFGEGRSHKHAVGGVVSLTNDPTVYTDGVIRPQSDNGHQIPHTDGAFEADPPHVMSVLCLQPAEEGGETLLVDMKRPAEDMSKEVLQGLYLPDAITVERGDKKATHPVYAANGRGGMTARFSNHEYNESYPGSPLAALGFRAVDEYLKDPVKQLVIPLEAKQLIIIDNDRVTHGRNAFESRAPRHLLRKWYTGQSDEQEIFLDTGIKEGLLTEVVADAVDDIRDDNL
jgi:alpha-ketoglutarate-dependent taurine dioxygenase